MLFWFSGCFLQNKPTHFTADVTADVTYV